MTYARVFFSVTALLLLIPSAAAAESAADPEARFIKALDAMMVELAPQSARAAATIRTAYREHLDLLVLDEYAALEDALSTGGLVPLPGRPEEFNLLPRTEGRSPIGEKDLANQASYISGRPATIGALLEVASRVKSGPLEITSLVRHSEYQDSLRATNVNANTAVPMHTMGLAFDIALVNTPLSRVYEIRDVLLGMQKAGDLLVIGERRQLVFHVVPHPSRLGYFTDVYARAAARAIGITPIDASPVPAALTEYTPIVHAEIVEFHPTDDFADEWWAASGTPTTYSVLVSASTAPLAPAATEEPAQPRRSFWARLVAGCTSLVYGVVRGARRLF